jgi:hypothetical protein
METVEQYLSILKELKRIEVRLQRLAEIFSERGREDLDDLLIAGLNMKANELAQAAQALGAIVPVIPVVETEEPGGEEE